MTKVYGTGVYDFRRHRVAEYPTSDQPDSKPSTTPTSITLVEIQRDRLTKIAEANWSKTAKEGGVVYNEELVKEIYENELLVKDDGKARRTVVLQRVMILEVSQYLENYLWPNFDPERSSFEHVMSMILMINEKFRENVAAWICFYDRKDMFKAFLERVLCLKEGRSLSIAEKTNYLLFMINAFQSLEDDIVSKKIMKLASLHCWHSLSFGRFQMELCLNPDLIKKWKRIAKKAKEAKKRGESFDMSVMLEVKFLRNFIEEFLEVLDSKVFYQGDENGGSDLHGFNQINEASILYCERFIEFLIDLLSQLPTRRYFKPLVADVAVVAKCHLSVLYRHEKGKLFAQLVDLLQYYEGFEIDDNLGRQMTDDEVLQAHYERFQAFQLLSFKKIPKLKELALANIGAIHKRADLSKKLSVLTPDELRDLVCNKLKLVSKNDPWTERVDFLVEVMVSFFEKQQSQKESINALPLYPNEQIMWDESLVPSINYSGEGCLALPKLNLQFLTLHDYLLRNFNLFRLESTYEIREDIQEAVPHLLAHTNHEGQPAFRGWSRMAVPIQEFKITEVKQPNIGEVKPSSVTAEVTFSISSYRAQIRSEWNALKEHDVLFLLCIHPSFEPLSADEAENASVPQKLGLQFVRGCEVIEMRDEEGTLMNDFTGRIKRDEWKPPKGELRTVRVALDTAQYHMNVSDIAERGAEDVYGTFNILMRRKPKENNFKAILESIRDLMNETCIVPDWLHDIFLGYGNPSAAQWTNMPDLLETVDFKDTFLDADHVRECFSDYQVVFTHSDGTENLNPGPPFRINIPRNLKGISHALPGNEKSTTDSVNVATKDIADSEKEKLIFEAYMPPDPGPYPQDQPKQNSVRFTPTQVGAIISGIQPGLTLVVGPPGTGKTDTAVQILNVLYHNCPSQRTLIITHSNQALNDLFEKIMERDVPARYLLRLGQGEQELATDLDFSRQGRVNAMLVRRLELLSEVERLARSLQLPEDVGYTCETAGYFWLLHVYSRWEQFLADCDKNQENPTFVKDRFPFTEFFSNTPQPVFIGKSFEEDMHAAKGCFQHLKTVFQELEECRAFELLKSTVDRANHLMTKQAKIVAMTCTHAALKRKDFLQLGFKYDNLLMEESAQILEIETFIPMLLQRQEDGHARLKRCILIGDHHQLPPVVKNMAFQKYSHMDQSLFTRFVRLGIPYIELNAQGRARPSLAQLYNWRYRDLGDLPYVKGNSFFRRANAGFSYDYQLVDVPDYDGKGETAPSPWFYQNEGEAEYLVSVFIYMRLLGYPANKISILTTYNGQKLLIRDVLNRRCAPYHYIGLPNKVATVDKFQGQQNDFILLSLVRTRFVGHLRDVRRLIVAMSRARLGLYVFCRRSLFEQCYELQPTFQLLLQRPDHLGLNLHEITPTTDRLVGETGPVRLVSDTKDMTRILNSMQQVHEAIIRSHEHLDYSGHPASEGRIEQNGSPDLCEKVTPVASISANSTTVVTKTLLNMNGNFVSSPLSLDLLLGMLAVGAEGDTLKQLLGFLRHESINQLHSESPSFKLLATGLNRGPSFTLVNSVWVDKSTPHLLSSYKEVLATVYKTRAKNVYLQKQVIESVKEINLWVKRETNKLIPEIVEKTDFGGDDVMVLVNALYFIGTWRNPFDLWKRNNLQFYLLNGQTVSVPFMTCDEKTFECGSFNGYSMIKLLYKRIEGCTFSMYIFLPDRKDGLEDLITGFHANDTLFHGDFDLKRKHLLNLLIPKFKISSTFKPEDVMKEMGLTLLFKKDNKEFSGIFEKDDQEAYYVSKMVQKSFIEVDEKGTKAASSSGQILYEGSAPEEESFVADHPFMFMIREEELKAVLFIGAVLDPSS